jgi:hypothetical protein
MPVPTRGLLAVFAVALLGCGRSDLLQPDDPALAVTDEPLDAGPSHKPQHCRAVGAFAPAGDVAYLETSKDTGAEYTATSAWAAPARGEQDVLWIAATWAHSGVETGLTLPDSFDLADGGTNATCDVCVIFCELDVRSGLCDARYLARSGIGTITEATRSPHGAMSSTLENVVFEEWDLDSDSPITPGECITLGSAELSASF